VTGQFVTSTFYRPNRNLHSWVEEFNRGKAVNQWFGKDWTPLRANLDVIRYLDLTDVRGKVTSGSFPHPLIGKTRQLDKTYFEALYKSPYGNTLLLEFAKTAIDAEQLGRHDVPDLLCLSFSSNDAVGHVWGPDSEEVLDVTLRSDLIVKEL